MAVRDHNTRLNQVAIAETETDNVFVQKWEETLAADLAKIKNA